MKIKILLLAVCLLAFGSINFGQTKKTTAVAPDHVVKNLYSAKAASPFFQTKSRALIDKYFTKDFADLIWKDAVESKGEVGALSFDPLFNAQDTEITNFKIGKPQYGEGNLQLADVPVTFKNMGKNETILFRLEQGAGKVWKISDIFYPGNEAPNDSLKGTYEYALTLPSNPEATTMEGQLHLGKTDSYILYVGKESGDFAAFCFANGSEVGRAILAVCKNGDQCEFTGEIDQNTTCKVDKETQNVLSASGKIAKIQTVKSLSQTDARKKKR